MKYFIIAGEASGDLHGANLIRAIKEKDAQAEFAFWGGDQMAEASKTEPLKHISELAFMGFVEVLANLKTILANFKLCEKHIQEFEPNKVILIDYPGFNLRMAKHIKSINLPVIYYISPQVWAWKENRVKKIKQYVDQMLCILPFEKAFYQKWNYETAYVGHPLLDVVAQFQAAVEKIDNAPIALIPGSRKQEIAKMLPIMLKTATKFPNENFIVTGAPAINESFYYQFQLPDNVQIMFGQTHQIMHKAKAALVTSGTATLETALFNTPEVVCYKGNYISYLLAKQLVKIKYISLVNLIMDKEVVKELIQGDFTAKNCIAELQKLLSQQGRATMLAEYKTLRTKLGGVGASARAAELIVGR
ncbi:MAG: lipid-A-disaccharide synthase [Bacteroidetes bacterium]|nr:lipid-A-disaccharide synthase [Bacteroidota bacterium]